MSNFDKVIKRQRKLLIANVTVTVATMAGFLASFATLL
jgi:hypothetical protein